MTQLQGLTADQVITLFEDVVGDSLDQTLELMLLNEVKDTIETERAWAMLTGLDQTQSANAGDTFLTTKPLPADFGLPSPRGIYVGTDLVAYKQIPFESQIDFQSITYAYYVDYYNNTYALCGSVSKSGTIKFFYRRTSPQMALVVNGGSPWIFPPRFHPLLVYEMAIKYYAVDQSSKAKAWDDRWVTYAQRIREAMISWDDSLQMGPLQTEMNMFVDPGSFPTIIDMDSGPGSGGTMFG